MDLFIQFSVPDDENMAAQLFMFFSAGFETAGSGVTYCLLEIARNQDIQNELRNEIARVIELNDNKITFEAVQQMTYLTKFVDGCQNNFIRLYYITIFINNFLIGIIFFQNV